jgi:hypothetical protein
MIATVVKTAVRNILKIILSEESLSFIPIQPAISNNNMFSGKLITNANAVSVTASLRAAFLSLVILFLKIQKTVA